MVDVSALVGLYSETVSLKIAGLEAICFISENTLLRKSISTFQALESSLNL